jgi:hypothetical protein
MACRAERVCEKVSTAIEQIFTSQRQIHLQTKAGKGLEVVNQGRVMDKRYLQSFFY